jgi:hypothetical protein
MSSGSGWIRERISSTYTIPFIEKKKKGIYMYWKREREGRSSIRVRWLEGRQG